MFPQYRAKVSLPPTLPLAPATPQLDSWATQHLNELKSMTTSAASSASDPPPPLPPSIVKYQAQPQASATKRMEPTIQDTLQQLSALAGGKGTAGAAGKKTKSQVSIYMMDQDKPIAHKENEDTANKTVIKQECE